jgi:hypothetical protein
MNNQPIDPHDIPLEVLFPSLKPEERRAMRDLLDDYCEVAWQVWNRLESDPLARNKALKIVADIVKREPKKNAA